MKNSTFFKIYLSGLLVFAIAGTANSQSVSIEEARQVALHFMGKAAADHGNAMERNVIQIIPYIDQQDTLYYAVNMEPASYVLVSADKSAKPIIGYSKNGVFTTSEQNPEYQAFMTPFRQELKVVKSSRSSKQSQNWEQWQKWLNNEASAGDRDTTVIVGPLLTTHWDQNKYYNDWCPADANAASDCGGHVYTGCIATAMGQVMRYYKYPNYGSGTHSYTHLLYGTQSADFNTHYNWSQMPDKLTSPNEEVAKLLWHCGVAVDLFYSTIGSGNLSTTIPYALDHYFGYDAPAFVPLINGEGIVKEELDHLRPVLYAACDGVECHAWVCDGYETDELGLSYFHMNWGWSGNSDEYYPLNSLNTDNGNFNNWHNAIIHIIPKACFQNYNHLANVPMMNMETVGEITASTAINNPFGLPIMLDAGSYIQLNPGTTIDQGTVFSTKIEGCLNADGTHFSDDGNEGRSQAHDNELAKSTEISVYPNPFSSNTTVAYELLADQTVDIKIFNATGTLVAQPVLQEQQKAGSHVYNFEANGLPTGVYFLVMQTGGQRMTKRLVLSH